MPVCGESINHIRNEMTWADKQIQVIFRSPSTTVRCPPLKWNTSTVTRSPAFRLDSTLKCSLVSCIHLSETARSAWISTSISLPTADPGFFALF